MKRILIIIAAAFSLSASAQTKEGKVVYERTVQMNNVRFGGGNLPPEIQAQMPKSRTEQFELLFNAQHSLFQFLQNRAYGGGGTFSSGRMVIQFKVGAAEITYIDFGKGSSVAQRQII